MVLKYADQIQSCTASNSKFRLLKMWQNINGLIDQRTAKGLEVFH